MAMIHSVMAGMALHGDYLIHGVRILQVERYPGLLDHGFSVLVTIALITVVL